jgi:hypothetical protein
VAAFNAGHWADAFLRFQNEWLRLRTDEIKALAQYANAVNQLHLGLVDAPRTALTRVLVLTQGVSVHQGVDLGALRRDCRVLLELLSGDGDAPALRSIPPLSLEELP